MSEGLAPIRSQSRTLPGRNWNGESADLPDDELRDDLQRDPQDVPDELTHTLRGPVDVGGVPRRHFSFADAPGYGGGAGNNPDFPRLQALRPDADPEAFLASLAQVPCAALMLDYDGTLAPFTRDPAQAHPWPGVLERLQRIAALPGARLCIVTGRPATDLLPLLALPQRPEIWGTHGWERLHPDGRVEVQVLAATARQALVEAGHRVAGLHGGGVRLEKKTASLALHWRGLPPAEVRPLRQWVEQAWRPLTRTDGADGEGDLALLPFDGGIELRVRACSKALAVRSVLEELPADGVCAYLGDDITDEDAFAALAPLGKRALPVLVRARLRPTAARAWLMPPAGLLAFLDRWLDRWQARPGR